MDNKEKRERLKKISDDLEKTVDALGKKIDKNIFEVVSALNALDVPTWGSCEGHLKWGTRGPWVDVIAPNRPMIRYRGEEEFRKKFRIKSDEIPKKYLERFNRQCFPNGPTEGFQEWQKANHILMERVSALLTEFYQFKSVLFNVRIRIEGSWGWYFRITNQDLDALYPACNHSTNAKLLSRRRAEFKRWATFLRKKYAEI